MDPNFQRDIQVSKNWSVIRRGVGLEAAQAIEAGYYLVRCDSPQVMGFKRMVLEMIQLD